MSQTSQTNIRFEPIAKVIREAQLAVPHYQRNYAWETEHVEQYFDDIRVAMTDKEPEYFLGSIVSTATGQIHEIVDGQQRLATTIILLAAIRDYLHSAGDRERATKLENEYLFDRDFRTLTISPRMTLNHVDDSYFTSRILASPGSAGRDTKANKPSHVRLENAADIARKHVAQITASTKHPADRLTDLVEYLRASVRVVWLQAQDTSNAFVIFETLNDRGLDLAVSDLLKNHVFHLADHGLQAAQQHWTAMLTTLEQTPSSIGVSEFIRHYWSSHHGATRQRDLYAAIKKQVRSKSQALEIARQLDAGARIYLALTTPNSEWWDKYGDSSRECIHTMNTLGMIQIRPLLLAVLDEFSIVEARTALRNMVSWGVRLLIVGGLGGGVMETHYSQAAVAVRGKTVKTAAGLRKHLSGVIPQDAEFQSAFRIARVSKATLARYYLSALERSSQGEREPELVPNPSSEEVDLEHVLPKVLDSAWKFNEEEHRANVARIGNLALLKRSVNSTIGNQSFTNKKRVYAKSKFKLTKSIAKQKAWSALDIDQRQNDLAAIAVKTWPLK